MRPPVRAVRPTGVDSAPEILRRIPSEAVLVSKS